MEIHYYRKSQNQGSVVRVVLPENGPADAALDGVFFYQDGLESPCAVSRGKTCDGAYEHAGNTCEPVRRFFEKKILPQARQVHSIMAFSIHPDTLNSENRLSSLDNSVRHALRMEPEGKVIYAISEKGKPLKEFDSLDAFMAAYQQAPAPNQEAGLRENEAEKTFEPNLELEEVMAR